MAMARAIYVEGSCERRILELAAASGAVSIERMSEAVGANPSTVRAAVKKSLDAGYLQRSTKTEYVRGYPRPTYQRTQKKLPPVHAFRNVAQSATRDDPLVGAMAAFWS